MTAAVSAVVESECRVDVKMGSRSVAAHSDAW